MSLSFTGSNEGKGWVPGTTLWSLLCLILLQTTPSRNCYRETVMPRFTHESETGKELKLVTFLTSRQEDPSLSTEHGCSRQHTHYFIIPVTKCNAVPYPNTTHRSIREQRQFSMHLTLGARWRWLLSHSGSFISDAEALGTHWIQGRVFFMDGVGVVSCGGNGKSVHHR